MKAIIVRTPGGVEQLSYVEVEKPNIQDGEILIKVKAISINPVDVKSRAGHGVFNHKKFEEGITLILGWDVSGVVEESKSPLFRTGDEVFGMVNFPGLGKTYAEYVAAPANQVALKPENISHEEAAAASLVGLTAWQALVTNAHLQKGQKVLIHAAAGGVGHIAVQIAKYLGATVIGTSSAKNREFVLGLGADGHIDYHNYDWANHPREFDFVLDTIGGDNIDNSLNVTKEGGSIISIPSGLNESVVEKAKLNGVNGSFILAHSDGENMKELAKLMKEGIIKPHIFHTYPFTEMAQAHLQVESGRTVGKVVIVL